MNRGILRRFGALLLAVSFMGTAGADAWGLHGCPHHDPVAAGAQAGGSGSDAGGHPGHARDAQGAPGAHAAGGETYTDAGDHGSHGDHGPCTCVGQCQTGGAQPVALAAAPPHEALDHARPDQDVPTGALEEALPGAPPFLLPFPNAPPRTS